jgi:hypothetical protein
VYQMFPPKPHMPFSSLPPVPDFPLNISFFELTTLIPPDEECCLQSSVWYNFLWSTLTSFPMDPNILISTSWKASLYNNKYSPIEYKFK